MAISADSKRVLQSRVEELRGKIAALNTEMQSLADQRTNILAKFNKLKTERDEFQRRLQAIRNDI